MAFGERRREHRVASGSDERAAVPARTAQRREQRTVTAVPEVSAEVSRKCLGGVSEVSRKCLEELLALLCRAPLLPQVGRVGLLPNLMAAVPTTTASELRLAQSSFKSYAGSALIAAIMPRMKTNAREGRVDRLSLLSTSFESTLLITTAREGLVMRTSRRRAAASVPEPRHQTGFLTCVGTKAIIAAMRFVLQHHCAAPAAESPRAAATASRAPKAGLGFACLLFG